MVVYCSDKCRVSYENMSSCVFGYNRVQVDEKQRIYQRDVHRADGLQKNFQK